MFQVKYSDVKCGPEAGAASFPAVEKKIMRRYLSALRSRFDIWGAIVLVAGLLCSLYVYLTADNELILEDDLESSKKYVNELENYGGNANMLGTELANWFGGLWHGKNLAFTIAAVTLIVAFWFFYVDYSSDSKTDSDHGSKLSS